MQVFVVVTQYMNASQDQAVFYTREEADLCLSELGSGGNPEVREYPVIGNIETPNVVYMARYYDRTNDVDDFIGVYGNYEQANTAAGVNGRALRRNIEPQS